MAKRPELQGTLTPAYGRDYGSKREVLTDFREGKDFIHNLLGRQTYCSIRDFCEGDMIKLRYNRLKYVVFYRVTGDDVRE